MKRKLFWYGCFLLMAGCVEPFEFVISDSSSLLVVEAFLSDRSFNETLAYPSDGRYFHVKLSRTGDVVNTRSEIVTGASVSLSDNLGNQVVYSEKAEEPGTYELLDPDFKALDDREYELRIMLGNDEVYASEWEKLPVADERGMGEIGFNELVQPMYRVESGERVVKDVAGIQPFISLARKSQSDVAYFRWDFVPNWIFIAPFDASRTKCWVGNPLYLNDYTLQEDRVGGYDQPLFFLETIRNERIFVDLSVLFVQRQLNEGYYYFLSELKEQNQGGLTVDKPPFNLQTNLKAISGEKNVVGYFGIGREHATRWYFNKEDLSYYVDNTLLADCLIEYGPPPPAPDCLFCTGYSFGEPSLTEPQWWRK